MLLRARRCPCTNWAAEYGRCSVAARPESRVTVGRSRTCICAPCRWVQWRPHVNGRQSDRACISAILAAALSYRPLRCRRSALRRGLGPDDPAIMIRNEVSGFEAASKPIDSPHPPHPCACMPEIMSQTHSPAAHARQGGRRPVGRVGRPGRMPAGRHGAQQSGSGRVPVAPPIPASQQIRNTTAQSARERAGNPHDRLLE